MEGYDQICQAIEVLANNQETLDKRLSAIESGISDLRKVVMDDLIGGIKDLYGENVRADGISGLKAKYGEKFGALEGDFSDLYGGDLWEKLYDAFSDVAEAEQEPKIMEVFNGLKAKFDKLKGVTAPAAVEATVVTPAPEGEKPAAEPAKDEAAAASMDDLIKKTIGKLKRNGAGIMPGARGD
jgi:hypothetical protein